MKLPRFGIVVIGRNEGERLERCLRSLVALHASLVICYVDSGSEDGSIEFATSLGALVHELDCNKPFTMSRARNAGWRVVLDAHPDLEFIQFFDGDCEPVKHWLQAGVDAMRQDPSLGVVSGRRRERFREQSVYNRLADMEWNTPIGMTNAVLGDMLVRVEVLKTVGGFNDTVIAAEDDEFCVRVRQQGWNILRLDADMSIHDIAMTKFSQWWRRMVRSGHGFAQVNLIHGASPTRYFRKELRRTMIWGALAPIAAILLAFPTKGLSILVLLLLYLLQAFKTYRGRRRLGDRSSDATSYAFFATISKFPCAAGAMEFYKRYLLKQTVTIIEYKNASS